MNQNLVRDVLRAKMGEQPLVKKYANTATAAVGLVVGLVVTVLSAGVDLPENVTTSLLVLVSLATVIGVKFTPNGVTDKQIDELEKYVGRHRAEG